MTILRGIVKSFDSGDYKATVQIVGSRQTYLSTVPVSRGIPSGEMVSGRTCAVLFYDEQNPNDALVVGVY